jgi:hypothetical protein
MAHIVTKLEAFNDRARGDYYVSHGLEDIVTLVDGRASIKMDVVKADSEIRGFVASEFVRILHHPDFADSLPGHLSGMLGAKQRIPIVVKRFEAIAAV